MKSMGTNKDFTREELYEFVWSQPISKLAKEFGLSDKGLTKRCIKHNIPTPPIGHWARVNSGQNPRKPKLPKIKDPTLETITFHIPDLSDIERRKQDSLVIDNSILEKASSYNWPTAVRNYHPVIKSSRAALSDAPDKYGRLTFDYNFPDLGLKVTKNTYARACILLEGIVRFMGSVGWSYRSKKMTYQKRKYVAEFCLENVQINIEIKEIVKQVDHIPKKRNRDSWYYAPRYDFHPTGLLEFIIHGPSNGFKTRWRDTNSTKIEDKIVEIVTSFMKCFHYSKLLIDEREMEEIVRQKQNEIRRELEKQKVLEEKRQETLIMHAAQHEKAQSIRALIDKLKLHSHDDPKLASWIEWASEVANKIDPVTDISLILNEHDKLAETHTFSINNI